MNAKLETMLDWFSAKWLSVLAVAAVILGLLFGRRAGRKAESAAIKIVKGTEAAKRANIHHETANEILRKAKKETAQNAKPKEATERNIFRDPIPRPTIRDRVRDINQRMLDSAD